MVCAPTQFSLYYTYIHMDIFHFYYRHALNECFREQGTRSRSFPADSSHIRHSNLFPLFSFSLSSPPRLRVILPDVSSRRLHRLFHSSFFSVLLPPFLQRNWPSPSFTIRQWYIVSFNCYFFPECVSPFH